MKTSMLKRKKIKPVTLCDVTIIDDDKLRKAITAASLGSTIEWFDFGIYGFVAYVSGKVFFPGADSNMQMVAALATFSVPFLIRLLDGLFFGTLGDKYGCQKILAITVVIMSISTFCIGLIPSYASIGIWVPILLLLCKMAQGFSISGEYTGASIFVAGYSPNRKRGFIGSWLGFGSIAGSVLDADVMVLISTIIDEDNFLEWGWHIPFFLALPSGLAGLYLRHILEEAPTFQQHVGKLERDDRQDLQEGPKVSSKEIATGHWCSLLTCVGLVIAINVIYCMLLTYMSSYLPHNLHCSENHGVLIIIAVMTGMLFVQPIMGLLSDRFGRRPSVIMGSIALFVLTIPAFILISNNIIGLIFARLPTLVVILNYFTRVMASTLPAMFPMHTRYSTLAAAFNISVLITGLIPTLTAWLMESSQNPMMPVYYLMVIAVVGLTTSVTMKETANQLLKGATPTTSDIQEAKGILGEHYSNIEQRIEDIDQEIAELQVKRIHLMQQHPCIEE